MDPSSLPQMRGLTVKPGNEERQSILFRLWDACHEEALIHKATVVLLASHDLYPRLLDPKT